MPFWTYILHCRGGAYYTGHTDNLDHRIADHQHGRFEGFTKNRLPVELVWSQQFTTRDEAKTAEKQIKGWSRPKKMALIRGDWDGISEFAKSKNDPSTSSGQAGEGREVRISAEVIAQILQAASTAHPEECCGILFGQGLQITAIQPTPNVHPAPETHFEIDPHTLIAAHKTQRAGGPRIVGYYHSHPAGEAVPSPTDSAMAAHDGMVWAIVAGDSLRLWRDLPTGFDPVPYAVVYTGDSG